MDIDVMQNLFSAINLFIVAGFALLIVFAIGFAIKRARKKNDSEK